MSLIELFAAARKKLFHVQSPFLADDFGARPSVAYPYPSKLPAFLAMLGLIEVKRWSMVASERKALLERFLEATVNSRIDTYLPGAYKNERLEIVPLRFAWHQPRGVDIRKSIGHFVHIPWTWFMQPIIATREPLEYFGYRFGSCPISEKIGSDMVNLPCNISHDNSEELINLFQDAIA